ncbi:DUF3519 domain-containing protein [Helicobacter pylori]|nr:DUF3519 domain-containing protein [Helicobacter pylori]
MIIEKASNKELELLKDANFKHPENIRASLDHDAIVHILKRHGVNSVNVKNGEIPITNEDIANYRYIVNHADAILRTLDNENKELISAFKQINGYAVVVEQAINKKNELALKTMYKSNGDYKDNNAYKKFSSTLTLNADAKVNHRLSSYSGATENNTQKSLTDQEDLLKTSENLNETTPKPTHLSPLEQANAKKLLKEQDAITPLKEFGTNYPEFVLRPKEALEKLLQEKNGQVAGAAFRDDLGGIDFVWGTPKTKDSVGYGLAHVLERREQQALADGLSEAEAKEYALNIVKSIPEVLEKGTKGTDHLGRVFVDYGNKRVGLNNTWNNKDLENHWVISSYELRDTTEKPAHFPTSQAITKEKDIHSLNSVENNPTTNALKKQELSPLEQANAEKLAKLQREQEQSEQEFLKAKEQENKRKEALKKKLEHERGNAGNIESQTKIEVGEDISAQRQEQLPKSRVRLNEREIYDLDYAIVKAKDLKPSFTTGGTQKRTDMNEEQIKSIAENFDPKKIFGSGGFEDLPIILHDGQVIAGNHRIAGMLNFTPKSRYIYEKAIKEYYNIDLKPDELLVRVPHNRLNNTEINNLAASSNQGRFNSESDHAIAVLSHYEAKLKELDQKLDADSIYSLKNIVAKNLNFDKATHPNVGDSNLALLMFNMPRTKTQGIELLNRWQKEFSNDIKSYEKVKKMFVDNAGSFHNLIHDMNFPNVSLNAYLSDIMDRSFANLKNYQTTSESLKDLSEKFYKTSSLEMFEKSEQKTSDISEILGGAIARFARFDDPSKALFEALRSDNIKKGLKDFKIADVTKDMFNPDSKELKDIDIYDFTHYLLMVNREPNENNPILKRLIEAVKDMQKESEKGIKKQKLETQWGPNYSEFKGDGLGAINKLLETKKGFVAGAFHKEGLGDIDLVWGNKDYGLEHILKRREDQALNNGINETEAKEYAMSVVKTIPEVIEKGVKVERNGRMAIEYKNIRVGLKDNWKGEKLPNHWVITGYEKRLENSESLYTSPLITKGETLPLNSNEPNPTTNALKTQEPLPPLEQANAKKLAKLESEKGIKAEALKKLHFDEIKKLIDESPNNGKDIIVIGDDNLTPEIVEYIHKKHAKVGIERLDEDEITAFNFTYPKNAKAIIDYQGIQHALNKHGINSPSVKFSKQPPITYKDIANYRDIVKNADETIKRDNRIISYKQVNGHFVVVEQINRNKSEFIFKTMFKEKGDYKNAPDYKKNIKEND